jgi:hypothetical protein
VAVCGKFLLSALGWWNWQTRTFEGRMPKGLRVQVPPRAQFPAILSVLRLIVQNRWLSSKQVEPIRNSSNIMHLRSIKLHRRRVSTCPAKKGSCSKRVDTPRRSNPSERIDNWVANTRYQRQRGRGENDPVFSRVRHAVCSPWQVPTGLQIASSAHGTAPHFSIRTD